VTLEFAIRLSEIMLGLALIQRSLEHLAAKAGEPILFLPRLVLCVLLILGVAPAWTCLALLVNGALIVRRFQGPYNGGADKMGLLILITLTLAHFAPNERWRAVCFGYLAAQVVLSYFISGWVKVVNPDWRSGRALRDVFLFSAYPVSESLRGWAGHPRLLTSAAWAVMGFELAFPLALLTAPGLFAALAIAASFHLANACLFGLNRFFWIWLTAYPSLIWLQGRMMGMAGT
jgi:hypothetical protein